MNDSFFLFSGVKRLPPSPIDRSKYFTPEKGAPHRPPVAQDQDRPSKGHDGKRGLVISSRDQNNGRNLLNQIVTSPAVLRNPSTRPVAQAAKFLPYTVRGHDGSRPVVVQPIASSGKSGITCCGKSWGPTKDMVVEHLARAHGISRSIAEVFSVLMMTSEGSRELMAACQTHLISLQALEAARRTQADTDTRAGQLESQVAEYKRDMEKEVAVLRSQLEAFQKERSHLVNTVAAVTQRAEKEEANVVALGQQLAQRDSHLRQLNSQLVGQRQQLRQTEQQLDRELAANRQTVEELRSRCHQLEQEQRAKEQEILDIGKRYAAHSREIETKMSQLQADNAVLRQEVASLKGSRGKAAARETELLTQLNTLRNKSENAMEMLQKNLATAEAEAAKNKQALRDLQAILESKSSEIAALRTEVKKREDEWLADSARRQEERDRAQAEEHRAQAEYRRREEAWLIKQQEWERREQEAAKAKRETEEEVFRVLLSAEQKVSAARLEKEQEVAKARMQVEAEISKLRREMEAQLEARHQLVVSHLKEAVLARTEDLKKAINVVDKATEQPSHVDFDKRLATDQRPSLLTSLSSDINLPSLLRGAAYGMAAERDSGLSLSPTTAMRMNSGLLHGGGGGDIGGHIMRGQSTLVEPQQSIGHHPVFSRSPQQPGGAQLGSSAMRSPNNFYKVTGCGYSFF